MMDFGSVVRSEGPLHVVRYGTPGYLAPELFSEGSASPASDIFSFGVLWFEMLTGFSPFADAQAVFSQKVPLDWYSMPMSTRIDIDALKRKEEEAMALAARVSGLMRRFDPELLLAGSVAAPLVGLIRSMLSQSPEDRPEAPQLCAAIADAESGAEVSTRPRIFISHSHEDRSRFVIKLGRALENRGFQVWIDEEKLLAGEAFWERITKAMEGSQFVIVVLSTHSVGSRGVAEELRIAQFLAVERGLSLVPIRIDPIPVEDIPMALRVRQVFDFVGWDNAGVFDERVARLSADIRLLREIQRG